MFVVNRFIDLVFLVDIGISFILMFEAGGSQGVRLVRDPDLIARNYIKGWFMFDVISWIPWDVIVVLVSLGQEGQGGEDVGSLKLLRSLRIVKMLAPG